MKKVAYVLSYKEPNYIRTQVLREMLDALDDVTTVTAINKNKSAFRYLETLVKLVWLRITQKPDIYILGFRGIEIYWPVRMITWRKPLIYDEFVNPYLWAIEEHRKAAPESLTARIIKKAVTRVLKNAQLVFTDTDAHAEYSSKEFGVDRHKFLTLHVSSNEKLFTASTEELPRTGDFTVFFYGTFLPLHGMDFILEAAQKLIGNEAIKFVIAGGASRQSDKNAFLEKIASSHLTNVDHISWIEFEELPRYIRQADLCLGGPFGDTPQSHKVITGKTFQFLSMAAPTLIGITDETHAFIDQENCLSVEQGSGSLLAEKIEWAYDNRELLPAIGSQGQKLYESTFSQAAQLSKLQNALEKVSS